MPFPPFDFIIQYMKVLLFGASGLLGSALHEILQEKGIAVLAPRKESVNLGNAEYLREYLKQLNFDVLINAAAHAKTDWCEDNKEECFKVNWIAPSIMSRCAREKGSIFIHFSTDYVFDGSKKEYFEEDTPSPLSVYGASKLYGEREIVKTGGHYYIVRTSLLYKENGKNFLSRIPEFILEEKEIICTYDLISAPTYVLYLAKAIIKLIEKNPPYGIYHISGGYPMSACDFAKLFAKVMGKSAIIKSIKAEDLGRKAKRPQNSFLNIYKYTTLVGFAPERPEIYMRRIYERVYRK